MVGNRSSEEAQPRGSMVYLEFGIPYIALPHCCCHCHCCCCFKCYCCCYCPLWRRAADLHDAQPRESNFGRQGPKRRFLRDDSGLAGKLQCCKFFGILPPLLVVTQSVTNRQFSSICFIVCTLQAIYIHTFFMVFHVHCPHGHLFNINQKNTQWHWQMCTPLR